MTRRALAALCLALVIAGAGGGVARACVQCNGGDPTIAALGLEQPYRHRVRVAVDERVTSHDSGAGELQRTTTQLRSTLHLPHGRVLVGAALPWVTARSSHAGAAAHVLNGLGDLEATLRIVVYRDRRFAPRHLVALTGGVKAPTGPRLEDGDGYPLPEDEQPGTGSWDPIAGASYAWVPGGLVSTLIAASYRHGTPGRRGDQRGGVLSSQALVQLQPLERLAIAAGLEVTWRAADRFASGAAQPDSGGAVLWAAPALLIVPARALVLRVAAAIPLASALAGTQREGAQVGLTLAWDIR